MLALSCPADAADRLKQPVDAPWTPPPGGMPADWAELTRRKLPRSPDVLRVTKRQWGAFHGTEMDLQLRRRGI